MPHWQNTEIYKENQTYQAQKLPLGGFCFFENKRVAQIPARFFYFSKIFIETPEIYLSKRPKNYKGEEQRFRAILTRGEVLLIIENRIHFRQIPAYVLTE